MWGGFGPSFLEDIQELFELRRLAYIPFVTEKDRIIFIPIVSKEAGDSYLKALNPLFNQIKGSRQHLIEAGHKLIEGDFLGSMR